MVPNRGRGRCGGVEDGRKSCAAPPCPRAQVYAAVEEGGGERWRLRRQSSSSWASNARQRREAASMASQRQQARERRLRSPEPSRP